MHFTLASHRLIATPHEQHERGKCVPHHAVVDKDVDKDVDRFTKCAMGIHRHDSVNKHSHNGSHSGSTLEYSRVQQSTTEYIRVEWEYSRSTAESPTTLEQEYSRSIAEYIRVQQEYNGITL
jgi:hypothetical protein